MNIRLRVQQLVVLTSLFIFSAALQAQDFSRSQPGRLGFDPERIDHLDSMLQSYVDQGEIAGSVTLILRNGRIAYSDAKGMQDIETGTPMAQDSIFRIASQTKAIISTAIMILHERGQLKISDPLSNYFPAWADAKVGVINDEGELELEGLNRPIFLRDLLTHTSGIGYGNWIGGNPTLLSAWGDAGFNGWYFASEEVPIGELITQMAALPQFAQPGQQWIYGYNLDILGGIIEVASGRPLNEFLADEIFTPLGMDDTQFYLPQEKADRLATVYQGKAGGGIEPAPQVGSIFGQGDYVNGPRTTFSGGAGLLSTASDYAKFLQMTLNGGQLNGARILSPKTVALMVTDHIATIGFNPGEGMGLGFSVLKDLGARGTPGSVGEYGWGGAYHSTYWVDPVENIVVVYLSQILSPNPGLDDFDKLRAGLYASLIESNLD
ncbi:MAG: serine hydrolase [Gammaproteobacteria bacterium]|nr:serine hydrolase [Gammaproteobacteria bacterium]